MNSNIFFKADGETAAQVIRVTLAQYNLRVIRSFDLRSALIAHEDCVCPYHGTSRCTCQFVVLLVYSATAGPVVLTAHSYDTQTHVQLVLDHLVQPNLALAWQIIIILEEVAQAQQLLAPPEARIRCEGCS
jgi:hypothetical protein